MKICQKSAIFSQKLRFFANLVSFFLNKRPCVRFLELYFPKKTCTNCHRNFVFADFQLLKNYSSGKRVLTICCGRHFFFTFFKILAFFAKKLFSKIKGCFFFHFFKTCPPNSCGSKLKKFENVFAKNRDVWSGGPFVFGGTAPHKLPWDFDFFAIFTKIFVYKPARRANFSNKKSKKQHNWVVIKLTWSSMKFAQKA